MTSMLALRPFLLAILFVFMYAAEHIVPEQSAPPYSKHDFKNMLIGALNFTIVFSGGFFLQKLLTLSSKDHFGLINLISLPVVASVLVQVVLIDLLMYWWHRVNHVSPLLWQFHLLHHTDEKMNSTTSLRFHPFEQLLSSLLKLIAFPLLGFSTTGVLIYGFLFYPVILLHHSNIRVPEKIDSIFRKLFVSPLMHRIHHSRIARETNSNYGSVFPIWDIIFNSYTSKPAGKVQFGVKKVSKDKNGESKIGQLI